MKMAIPASTFCHGQLLHDQLINDQNQFSPVEHKIQLSLNCIVDNPPKQAESI